MKRYGEEIKINQAQITLPDFLKSFNDNMPASFPKATVPLLKKFKEANPPLFTHGDTWSLELHRKKVMDWLPKNLETN